ncbi:uncharacterized protein LOC123551395 isoform X1 [Mercenaria mercenaria]|uniref:uncharacterized protein LOC123551395 isoform X1 n=1 Tax=Mercenaria mercenaria TaxID=6596 RepID=UPI00234FA516|nr:uncharacterized protein LOC123551395 isoform X1 [Mercenaria mercenaria]
MADETVDIERDKRMNRLCIASTVIVLLSLVCIIVGSLAIAQSAPEYTFPYCLGGAMIAGVMSIVSSCCNMCVYCEYRSMSRDNIQSWACWMSVVISFLMISLILGVGISGIWGMSQTTDRIKVENKLQRNSYDIAYENANLEYAVVSFVLVLILIILHIIAWCQCCSFLNTYGFDNSSAYFQQELNRMERLIRDNPNATRENRSRGVLYSIPIPEIYHGTLQQPSAPSESSVSPNEDNRDISPDSSLDRLSPSFNHVTSTENGANRSPEVQSDERPPPSYEELEGDLPSYREVVTEGRYVSTGNTEFITKI